MSDYRQQAIKDVDETLEGIQDKYVPARLRPMYRYAVAQREARLRERDALQDAINTFNMTRLIMDKAARDEAAELIEEWRAALNPVKEGEL